MYSITRKIECDIGHRIPNHFSQCCHIHGHRYVIEATCVGELVREGSSKDMVLDFSFLKDEMMKVIHHTADHALILSLEDPLLDVLMGYGSGNVTCEGGRVEITDFGKIYVIEASPTAEALAAHWFYQLEPRVSARSEGQAELRFIKVYETPNCWALYPA
jgi:6-pyruvoyltetrahydropterin/6-carboxytetrahydropterin synthase